MVNLKLFIVYYEVNFCECCLSISLVDLKLFIIIYAEFGEYCLSSLMVNQKLFIIIELIF